jgi:hypothetical protein
VPITPRPLKHCERHEQRATAGAPLRVVIADDQTLVRSGFQLILGGAGITVVRGWPG